MEELVSAIKGANGDVEDVVVEASPTRQRPFWTVAVLTSLSIDPGVAGHDEARHRQLEADVAAISAGKSVAFRIERAKMRATRN